MKQYAGAYAEGFEWPQTGLQSDDDDMDDSEGVCDKPNCGLAPVLVTEYCNTAITVIHNFPEVDPDCTPPEAVVIDSLLNVDQYCGDKSASSESSNGKPGRDIAEVAAATELILPKGSFRTTSLVRQTDRQVAIHIHTDMHWFFFSLIRPAAQLLFFYMARCENISKLVWTGY